MVVKNKKRSLKRVLFPDICQKVADKTGYELELVQSVVSHYFYVFHLFTQNPFIPRIRIPTLGTFIPRYNKIRRLMISSASHKNFTTFVNRALVLKRLSTEGHSGPRDPKSSETNTWRKCSKKLSQYLRLHRKISGEGDYQK